MLIGGVVGGVGLTLYIVAFAYPILSPIQRLAGLAALGGGALCVVALFAVQIIWTIGGLIVAVLVAEACNVAYKMVVKHESLRQALGEAVSSGEQKAMDLVTETEAKYQSIAADVFQGMEVLVARLKEVAPTDPLVAQVGDHNWGGLGTVLSTASKDLWQKMLDIGKVKPISAK